MSNNTVTQEQVNLILNLSTVEYQKFGTKTLVGVCTLPNGFILVEDASCVDPANFCENIGKDIIRKRFENKVWELEGYALQNKIGGFDAKTVLDNAYAQCEKVAKECEVKE